MKCLIVITVMLRVCILMLGWVLGRTVYSLFQYLWLLGFLVQKLQIQYAFNP